MSAMSGGAVQGYAGNAFATKKKINRYWHAALNLLVYSN
jgi:hypothetical protein